MRSAIYYSVIAVCCYLFGIFIGHTGKDCPGPPALTYQDGLQDGLDLTYELSIFLVQESNQSLRDSATTATRERFMELFKESLHD